jgi:hypothetical protein
MRHYRSSIPIAAKERVVSTHPSNGLKQKVECVLDGEVVGVRWFDQDGSMGSETPLKNGVRHGTMYYFHGSDRTLRVNFAEPYRNGLAHGTARQWSTYDGASIGCYTMKRGTGIDLWRGEAYSGSSIHLQEARYLKDGNWHGFEWWLNEDQKTVHQENHFWENLQHGILRRWNADGRLMRGYPRYWVRNERVTKRQYMLACLQDHNLPSFCEADNRPRRKFPPEVLSAITKTARDSAARKKGRGAGALRAIA